MSSMIIYLQVIRYIVDYLWLFMGFRKKKRISLYQSYNESIDVKKREEQKNLLKKLKERA